MGQMSKYSAKCQVVSGRQTGEANPIEHMYRLQIQIDYCAVSIRRFCVRFESL